MVTVRIHVDQGRLATNRTQGTDGPIISVAEGGRVVAWGGTIEILCPSCSAMVGRFIQPDATHAHFIFAPGAGALWRERPEERTND